jgi:hypothetical protein
MRFLGHHINVRSHPTTGDLTSIVVIPKDRTQRLREKIKQNFSRKTWGRSLEELVNQLNPILRGWSNFYRHAWGAKRVFVSIDHYVWWTIRYWLEKRHPDMGMRALGKRYGWRKPGGRMVRWKGGDTKVFSLAAVKVLPYRLAWQKTPDFGITLAESPVHNERCTPGSVRGVQKPAPGRPE